MSTPLKKLEALIRELIKKELDEASVTGNLDGGEGPPQTPNAFKKKKKKKDESVNETNPSPAQAGKLFDKLLKKQTKGNLPSPKDIETVFSLMRKKYGIKSESRNEGPFSGAASVVGGYDDFIIPKNKMSKAKGQYKKMMDYLKMAGKSMTQPGEIDTMVMHMESGYSEMIALWKNVKEVKRESVTEGKYHDYRNDESLSPKQKIGYSMREVRDKLTELDKLVKMNVRFKNEVGVDSTSYWKNTHNAMNKISERLVKLANKVGQLY